MLDLIHRIYEADESFKSLDFMVKTKLYTSQIVIQILLGTLLPLFLLGSTQVFRLTERARRTTYAIAGSLTLIGIFAMRWNVVIGGQLFSKSFLGYTTYKLGFATREGLLPSLLLMLLPFAILWFLIRILPPWSNGEDSSGAHARGGL
jgi:predicted membrane protein